MRLIPSTSVNIRVGDGTIIGPDSIIRVAKESEFNNCYIDKNSIGNLGKNCTIGEGFEGTFDSGCVVVKGFQWEGKGEIPQHKEISSSRFGKLLDQKKKIDPS